MENIIYTKLDYRHPRANDCTWTLDDKTLLLTLQPCATSDGMQLYYQQIYVTLDGDDKKYYAEPQINTRSVTIQLDKNPTTVYLYGSITPQCVPTTTNQYVKLSMKFGSNDELTVQADDEHDLATIVLHTVDYTNQKADLSITVTNRRRMVITLGYNYISADVEVTTTEVKPQTKTITNNLKYVDGDIPASINVGQTLSVSVTPQDGYTFKGAASGTLPQLTYTDSYGDIRTVPFTITDNTATLSFVVLEQYDKITLKGGATPITPITKNYGTVNVYVVNDDDLDQLARKRFYTETTTSGSTIVDLGKYIYSIKRIFTHISTIEQEESLKLGKYNCSDITVHQPQEDTVTLTTNVNIDNDGFTNEMYDAETQLFLPFKGLVSIPNSILGMNNLQLVIAINVLSGKGTYTLQYRDATLNYVTFYCDDFEPSSDIYFSTENINAMGQLAENDAKAKWGLTPYVLMTYNRPSLSECTTSYPAYLSDATGYCKFEDIVLNMSFYASDDNKMKLKPTQQDVSEITQQLASGVFMTDV